MSGRDDLIARIRAASRPLPKPVTVEGIGECFVRVMTPYDSEIARQAIARHAAKQDGRDTGRFLATILCDAEGAAMFDADSDDDTLMLSQLPGDAAAAIFKAHREANGIVTTAEEAQALGKA